MHEVGHALGLKHSNVPGSIMQPLIKLNYKPDFKLHDDDVRGIQVSSMVYHAKFLPVFVSWSIQISLLYFLLLVKPVLLKLRKYTVVYVGLNLLHHTFILNMEN